MSTPLSLAPRQPAWWIATMSGQGKFPGLLALFSVVVFAGCASVPGPNSSDPAMTSHPGSVGRTVQAPVKPTPDTAPAADARGADARPVDGDGRSGDWRAPTASSSRDALESGRELSRSQSPNQMVAPPRPVGDLWTRIRAGFALPELDTPLVAEKERFYLQRPDYLQRMFERGGRYLFYIVEEIERRGMPTELALLPFVESAMNPVALSSAKAAGLWQFIPSTGKVYNLSQNWWVDNRRDVVQSTHAALDYLQKIRAMNDNDWFLALASYNWGEGSVARAVSRNRARGKGTDYLSLSMPQETRHYVPKLIAIKNIVARAQDLGIGLPALPNRPYFVTIEKTGPIDLKLAAQFAGMSVEEFVALNPAHNRPVIAASKNHEIKLPADRMDAFLDAVERHGESRKAFASWQPHTLQAGETLETLAQRGGTTVAELQKANGLRPGTRLLAGTRIIAPHWKPIEDERRVEAFVAPRVYERVDLPPQYHVVRRKETLAAIASRYGVSASTLQRWNPPGKSAQPGTRLIVRPATSQTLLTDEQGDRQVIARAASDAQVETLKAGAPISESPSLGVAVQRTIRGSTAPSSGDDADRLRNHVAKNRAAPVNRKIATRAGKPAANGSANARAAARAPAQALRTVAPKAVAKPGDPRRTPRT